MITNLSSQELRKAANLKERIAKLEKQLVKIFGKNSSISTALKANRKMSAAGRAAIRAAQKARWAKAKGKKVKKSKRKMSAKARARIAAAAKARWAKAKAAGKNKL